MSTGYPPARIAALLAAWALALAGIVFWLVQRESDPLCSVLDDTFAMACSPTLPDAATLAPGTLVDGAGRPQGTLADASCLLPGATPAALAIARTAARPDTLPRQTYTTLRGAGSTAIPGPAGLFSDSARWPDLHEVGVEAHDLRQASLGNAPGMASALACSLRVDCAGRLVSGELRLVTGVLEAQVRYRPIGADQRALAPRAGRGTNPLLPADGAWALPVRRALAVQYADAAVLKALEQCTQAIARSHSGSATASITGTGQRGAFASDSVTHPLGKVALVSARGSEASDCDPGLGRERSHAYAQALVDSMSDGGLRMAAEVRASSGRYRVGRCPTNGRRLPSNNMLVTGAVAATELDGELALLVREAGPHTLEVSWDGFPSDARLRVLAPGGQVLHDAALTTERGSQRFEVVGPGVFRVQPRAVARIERQGESGVKSSSFHAQLHALAWPPGGEAAARAADGAAADEAAGSAPADDAGNDDAG